VYKELEYSVYQDIQVEGVRKSLLIIVEIEGLVRLVSGVVVFLGLFRELGDREFEV